MQYNPFHACLPKIQYYYTPETISLSQFPSKIQYYYTPKTISLPPFPPKIQYYYTPETISLPPFPPDVIVGPFILVKRYKIETTVLRL